MNIISAKNVVRTFGTGPLTETVLHGISIDVRAGEFLAIMGKSGAGKSTLLYQLSVLDEPTSGEIIINGVNIIGLDEAAATTFRLNTLGYVFQDYALVPDLSAEENVMLPLIMRGETWASAKESARKAIDDVGLSGKYLNLPAELSGGEQQRMAIARALAGRPKILFADEPTANLDSQSGQSIIELITRLNQEFGQTVVMVTHEREYALSANRIVNMADGKITGEEVLR